MKTKKTDTLADQCFLNTYRQTGRQTETLIELLIDLLIEWLTDISMQTIVASRASFHYIAERHAHLPAHARLTELYRMALGPISCSLFSINYRIQHCSPTHAQTGADKLSSQSSAKFATRTESWPVRIVGIGNFFLSSCFGVGKFN